MKWVSVLVEGQTEETFIREILNPYFQPKGLSLTAILATTKRTRGGSHYKGGISSFGKVETDIRLLLRDTNSTLVTTLIDYYGLDGKDFPGWDTKPVGTCYQQVQHLEQALATHIANDKFFPYLALHEFEAMLMTSPEDIVRNVPGVPNNCLPRLKRLKEEFDSPEEINHERPPSKRIMEIIETYDKNFGVYIAVDIGLERIRRECRHFNDWMNHLESLLES